MQGAARERVKETADEIVELEGGWTTSEREIIKQELADAAASSSSSSSSSSSGEAGDLLSQQLSEKDADRLEKFRLLRARKVLLALETPSSSDDDDDDDDT